MTDFVSESFANFAGVCAILFSLLMHPEVGCHCVCVYYN